MNIAIIGGGFTGLTAAYRLAQKGHTVAVYEKENKLGGLAMGFKAKHWNWYLESAYHHLFTNDSAIIHLMSDLGISDTLIVKRPVTATLYNDSMYQLDSPASLLAFPGLPFFERIRTGIFLAFMKYNPFWKPLERITAKHAAIAIGGMSGWKTIWEPLLVGKFGTYAERVAASWLWARIVKRTPSLGYIRGGFQTLVDTLERNITDMGGTIYKGSEIRSIERLSSSLFSLSVFGSKKPVLFDKIILTTPTPIAAKLFPDLSTCLHDAFRIPHLHAQVLILETKEPLMKDVYWLNITDASYPFLAVVQHTNYMDKKQYGGNHIAYIGNYLPSDHPYLKLSKEKLFSIFKPYLEKIFHSRIQNPTSYLFTAPYAQPVHELNYSKKAPPLKTNIDGVYLANMDSIYPWDRGTNYAVELGEKIAKLITL